jgi:sugar/nucleoside kinase (ribokinase family)
VDYLVLGHVAKDVLPVGGGHAPGGTVIYSALTAKRLGLQVAIVTACAPEDRGLLDVARDEGIQVHVAPSTTTTTFHNTYGPDGRRTQIISARAAPIDYSDIPPAWLGAPIVHLGPIAQELPAGLVTAFPDCLLGVTPQGWMRSWDEHQEPGGRRVEHSAWPVPPPLRSLPPNAFLVLSFEDLGYTYDLLDQYVNLAPLVAVTQERHEAYICSRGECTMVPASPASNVDPTGAGDVFAAALFARYLETADLVTSARFAHAAAACNIEGSGPPAIPDRNMIEERLRIMNYEF